ncbi:hypothetical protein D9613_009074 [Agrocybe pediades]|uniref:Peptidase M48 domain-containing protein n=1 Tax=Agrocybe pediades TaxID=84607 RepID=A0A8H4R5X2_9AGAR|nr:hypothetical protein D9613_009074 [Agrocybe pediades]
MFRALSRNIPRNTVRQTPIRTRQFSASSKQGASIAAGVAIGGVGGIYYVSYLERVPETGRWRFMNTSLEYEAKAELSRAQLKQELGPLTLPPNHPLTRHVRRVATRILQSSNLGILRGDEQPNFLSPFGLGLDLEGNSWNPDAELGAAKDPGPVYGPTKEWDVIVVNDMKTVNAMASPGVIVVFTGILPICQDEEGLAAVLSHEIGHVVARHTAERLSSASVALGLVALLAILGVDVGLSNLIHTYFVDLPNSRTQEKEADLIGLRLMSRACYNPEASPQMFARLGQLEAKMRGKSLDFFQTHPSSESRVKFLEERLPEAHAIVSSNPDCENVRHQLEAFRETAHPLRRTPTGFEIL